MHTLVSFTTKTHKKCNNDSVMLRIEPRRSIKHKTITLDIQAKETKKLICTRQVQVREERARLVSLRQVISEQIYEQVNTLNTSDDLVVLEGQTKLSDKHLEQELAKYKANRFTVLVSTENSPASKRKNKADKKGLRQSLKDNIVGRLFTNLSQDKEKSTEKGKKSSKKSRPISAGPQTQKLSTVSKPIDSLMLSPRNNRSDTAISKKSAPPPPNPPKSNSSSNLQTIKSQKTKRAPLPPELISPQKSVSLSSIKRRAPPVPITKC